MKGALLGGVQSGSGKTTVMLALLQRHLRLGQSVAAFKAGPDFLDPMWHQAVLGQASYNLDTQMMGPQECQRVLCNAQGDYLWVEGVMGLFDGRHGVGGAGSGADLALVLGLPVVLVVDAKGQAGSIAPLVAGFELYAQKKGIQIAGIVANRVGSQGHADLLKGILAEENLPPLLGWMDKKAPNLLERHLGLVRPEEWELPDLASSLNLDDQALERALGLVSLRTKVKERTTKRLLGKRIAIARDLACCFIYPANLDWLKEQGAEVVFFSPLNSEPLPPEIDGLWLPGGYPELYGAQLAGSSSWETIQVFIEAGGAVLAECGGAMLLGETLIDLQNESHPMAGVFDFKSKMQTRLAGLGYAEEQSGARGHEFHHSSRIGGAKCYAAAFELDKGDQGLKYKQVRASYIHWYFPSAPEAVARWFSGQ